MRMVCLALMVSMLSASDLSPTSKRLTDLLVLLNSYTPPPNQEERARAELKRLFADSSPEADELVVQLLIVPTAFPKLLDDEAVRRGRRLLPLLTKYRDRGYPLPRQVREQLPIYALTSPSERRRLLDRIEARITGEKILGIPAEVWKVLQPPLEPEKKIRQQKAWTPQTIEYQMARDAALDKLFVLTSAAADEAVVLLLEFDIHEMFRESLKEEVLQRGRRMLPFLRKYWSKPPMLLLEHYPAKMRAEPMQRMLDYEALIEWIELGEN